MSSNWGKNLKISIFGESHGEGIGVVIDGLPCGETIDMDELLAFMKRRAPGAHRASTPRRETDAPTILSGYWRQHTTGTPLAAVIRNNDTHSADYSNIATVARPGHADFTGYVRYGGFNDIRGGGHFSGRLTAPLTFAGGVAKQILSRREITVGAHIYSAAGISDTPFDPVTVTGELLREVGAKPFPTISQKAGEKMSDAIEAARLELDSVGGVVECAVTGFPAGIGSPMFDGLENVIASLMFGIPAVKGIEFGLGFEASSLKGSQNNDSFVLHDGKIQTKTNNHGGILGGISSGMPIILRVAFKPTPSISQMQHSVDFVNMTQEELTIHGRHDPCVVVRAVPVVEAAVALALLESMLGQGKI